MDLDHPSFPHLQRKVEKLESYLQEMLSQEHYFREFYDNLTESTDILVIALDFQGNIILFNKFAEKLTGYTRQELIGKNWFDTLVPKERFESVHQMFELLPKNGLPKQFDNPIITKSGELKYISWRNSELTQNDEILGCISFGFDITEIVESREKAQESAAILHSISNNTITGLVLCDPKGKFVHANEAFCQLVGYSLDELKQISFHQLTYPDDLEREMMLLDELQQQQRTFYNIEKRYLTKDNQHIWIETNISCYRDDKGHILNYTGVVQNITSRKLSDQALKESEKRYRLIFENSGTANSIFSTDFYLLAQNSLFKKYLALIKADDAIGQSVWEIFGEERGKEVCERLNNVAKTKMPLSFVNEFDLPSGKMWFNSMYQPIFDERDNLIGIQIISQDITKSKRDELEIRLSEDKFRSIFENATIGMLLTSIDGHIIKVNTAFAEMLGYSIEEIEKMGMNDFTAPEDWNISWNKVENLLSNQKQQERFTKRYLHKDGSLIWADIGAYLLKDAYDKPMYFITHVQDISERKIMELYLKSKNDELTALEEELRSRNEDLTDANNEFAQLNEEYIAQNEMLRLTNEAMLKAKDKAEESDRLKSAFLANMSHEIRTPMNAILGFTSLLETDLSKEKQSKYIQLVKKSGNNLMSIINDILDISRIESNQLAIHISAGNINDMVDDVFQMFAPIEQQRIVKIQHFKELPKDKALVLTDIDRLKQILVNLISNSSKFTSKGSIQFGYNVVLNELVFYVKDSGIGIPKDKQSLIFDRFRQADDNFTSKKYGGTGLGLSIAKGIIELMQGKIWVESEENAGATFYFTVPYQPVVDAKPEKELTSQLNYDWHSKKVLVVEDDLFNTEYLLEVLSETGIIVTETPSGKEAIRLFEQNPNFDVILMDIRLPDINGYDVTKYIKKIKPEVMVLAQTAYASAEDRNTSFAAGCDDFISKPLNRLELLDKINRLLSLSQS